MVDIEAEIARVEKALRVTKSQHLRNDYTKYLKKLYRRRAREKAVLLNGSRKRNES